MKKKTRKSTKPVEELSKQEELTHYVGVLMEDMESKFNMVIEKVEGLEESLNHKIDVKFAEQDLRFDRIEFVLGKHGDTLAGHTKILDEHSTILGEHTKILDEHTKILNEHSKVLAEHSTTLGEHGESLDRLETKFDALAKKVDQHDKDIQEIKTVVFTH